MSKLLIFIVLTVSTSFCEVVLPPNLVKEKNKVLGHTRETMQESKALLKKAYANRKLKKKDLEALRAIEIKFDKINKLLERY